MFDSIRLKLAYRTPGQTWRVVAASLVVALVVATVVLVFRETRPDNQVFAVVMHTDSDRSQTSLRDRRILALATQAMREDAQLTVYVGDDAPEVRQQVVTSRRLGRAVDNKEAPLPVAERDAIRDDVERTLNGLPPSPTTSVSGALRLLASRINSAHRSGAKLVVGWLVGDSISTVEGCNFYVLDMSPEGTDATARTCLGSSPVDLMGAEIRLAGIGQDLTGRTDPVVSVGTIAVVSRMIELAHGTPRLTYLDGGPTGVAAFGA